MAADPSPVSAAHFRYVAERTPGDDAFLKALKHEASAAGIPEIWIGPPQASFMQILLKLSKAKRVIDVGTLAGYSAITMARALPPTGRVDTLELVERHAVFAERWIAKSDVAKKVRVHRGNAREILPRFKSNSADAAFLDADKAGYPIYLKECLRIVRRGGIIMADNAFAFGQLLDDSPTDREVPAVRAFNDLMAKADALHGVIVPVGDGLWVAVKK